MPTTAPETPPNPWTVAAAGNATSSSPYDQRSVIAEHVKKLPEEAPLRTLHASQAFEDRLRKYEAADARADIAQKRYKRWGWIALALATAATLASAITLIPVTDSLPKSMRPWVSGFQTAAVVLTFVIVWSLKRYRAIDKWITARAEAEHLRGLIFYDLIATPAPEGFDAKCLLSEKLGLLQAAHVEYQQGFYMSGVARHSQQTWHQNVPSRIATLSAGLAIVLSMISALDLWPGFLSGILERLQLDRQSNRWELGFNTFASGLLAYVSAYTLMNQDERNAALYRHSLNRLSTLVNKELAEVQTAAAAGNVARVLKYAGDVRQILEADHTAWQFNRPPTDPTVGPPDGVKL